MPLGKSFKGGEERYYLNSFNYATFKDMYCLFCDMCTAFIMSSFSWLSLSVMLQHNVNILALPTVSCMTMLTASYF